MNETLTQYGVEDLSAVLDGFSSLGNDILTGDIEDFIKPVHKKELKKFKMKEACELIGRSDAFLRKLEASDPSFQPEKINGTRYYTLEQINRIRDKAGTRYTRPKGSNPIIIAISHFKGGVGKTTVTKNLTDKIALAGLRALSIGLDGQGTDALYYGHIPDLDISWDDTISTALLDDPKLIKGLIKKTYFDGIHIIPGNLSLTQVEIKLNDHQEQMRQSKNLGFPDERLANALKYIKDDYDVILLDCGPNLNILTTNAIEACNALLVPVPPALPDLASFCTYCKTLLEHLQVFKKNKSLDFFRILVSKHPKNKAAENVLRMMLKQFGSFVMQKQLVYSAEIEKAATNFSSIYELPSNSQKTYQRAIESANSVFDEILSAFKEIWEISTLKERAEDA